MAVNRASQGERERLEAPLAVVVLGTRPEMIKMASTVSALRSAPRIASYIVFTGQHAELMADAAAVSGVVADLEIAPLGSGRSMTDLLGHLVSELGAALSDRPVGCVVVQGDTVSALAGALVSELLGYPLVHVEAGVRSFMKDDPFPEETIRRMISTITERHLCFTEVARSNLLSEGHDAKTVVVVPHPLRERIGQRARTSARPTSNVLVTLHRRERRSERFASLLRIILAIQGVHTAANWTFVWHPSLDADVGWARAELERLGVSVVLPMDPDLFLSALLEARLVITDSAGVSEEAQLLGKPLVVLRVSSETRLDQRPLGPVCMTESPEVASEFLQSVLDGRPTIAQVVEPQGGLTSSGTAIVSEIERLLS